MGPSAIYPRHPDSAKKAFDSGENYEDDPPDTIYNQTIRRYNIPYNLDTFFLIGKDTFEINLHHYCTFDSAISLPKGYLEYYKLKSFVTHDFVTKVQVTKNNIPLLTKLVTKKDFDSLLYESLRQYAILFDPHLKLEKDTFRIYYGISIPLTDLGIPAKISIAKNGKISYSDGY